MENQNLEKKPDRSSNIELLRIISMLLIILCHFWGHAVYLPQDYPHNAFYYIKLMTSGWPGAVGNSVFMLISGYFLCKSDFSIKKLLKFWFQVFSISVAIGIFVYFSKIPSFGFYSIKDFSEFGYSAAKPISKFDLFKSFVPTVSGINWYASKYFVFYLFTPILKKIINCLTQKEHLYLTVLMFVIGTVTKMIPGQGLAAPSNIYYFFLAYFIGSYIRFYSPKLFEDNKRNLTISLSFLLLVIISNLSISIISNNNTTIQKFSRFLFITDINQFPIWIISIFLFCFSKNLRVPNNKIVNSLGHSTFDVYLIHGNPILREIIWFYFFKSDYFIQNGLELVFMLFIFVLYALCYLIYVIRSSTIEKYFIKIIDKAYTVYQKANL